MRSTAISTVLALSLFATATPAVAALSCSSLESSGQVANINEVRSSGSNPNSNPAQFVEIYFFSAVTTSGWTLCRDKNPSPECDSIPNGSYAAGDFWYTTALNVNASGDEYILRDGSGDVLDHLFYSNTGSCGTAEWDVDVGCKSSCISVSSSLKDIARQPDGTGGWTNTNNNTAGSTNGGGPDHIRLEHDGSGLTCAPETVTVKACADSSCSALYSGSVTTTLSTAPSSTPGWTSSNPITFSGGFTTATLRITSVGSYTLASGSTSPSTSAATRCFIDTTESCVISFADSGFVFDVPNHVAETSQTIQVSAVRKSDSAAVCVPGFAGVTRSLDFYSTYLNPGSGTLTPRVGGTSIANAAPGTAVSLTFDPSGVASTNLQYADVGSMRLNASYTGTVANGDSGLSMTGQDDFVSKPQDFLLGISGNPAATGPTGAVFKKAGVAFPISVTARNASAVATPNFGKEAAYGSEPGAQSVKLETSLIAPVGGIAPALIASSGFGAFGSGGNPAGSASGDWLWNEVGIISLNPRLNSGDYLGAGDVTGTTSGNVGRFVPARLGVAANVPSLAPACGGSFSYFGQDFGFATAPVFTITGLAAGGSTTQNYDSSYWRLSKTLTTRSYAKPTALVTSAALSRTTDGGAALLAGTATVWDGMASLSVTGDRFTFSKPSLAESALAGQIELSLPAAELTDDDGVCYDPALSGSCSAFTVTGIGGTELRWGRVVLSNAFGPEVMDLQVPMQAQYFLNGLFVPNGADSCSSVTPISLNDPNTADTLDLAETCVLDNGVLDGASGTYGVSRAGCPTAASSNLYTALPTSGLYTLWLQKPGAGNTGPLDVTATVPTWLQFPWTTSSDSNPTARIGFGVFAGEQWQIFEREVY